MCSFCNSQVAIWLVPRHLNATLFKAALPFLPQLLSSQSLVENNNECNEMIGGKVFCNLTENWNGYSIIEFVVFWSQLLSYCWKLHFCLESVHCTSTDCKCDVCINFHRLRVPTTQLAGWSWNVRNGFTHANCPPKHNCHHGKPNCWLQWVSGWVIFLRGFPRMLPAWYMPVTFFSLPTLI